MHSQDQSYQNPEEEKSQQKNPKQMASTWVKFDLYKNFPVYFDWKHNLFSLSPVVDKITFLEIF